jgi:DNA topoisomerase-1
MGSVYSSLDRDDDVLVVGLNRAVDVLAKKLASVRILGPHPADQDTVSVRKGRFGPYAQHGKTVVNLPRELAMDDVSLTEAVALLAQKGKVLKPKSGKAGKSAVRGRAGSPAASPEDVAVASAAPRSKSAVKSKTIKALKANGKSTGSGTKSATRRKATG